ncbi:MAG TPA: S8 family serine peptidase [Verrucomicrobiae bacterium]|nr:S8 family serine peptidase [Verrucomicrobiae bacterium]
MPIAWWNFCQPPLALGVGLLLGVGGALPLRAAEAGLPAVTVQQISALLDEKEARTPAQRKLHSHLVYAIKMNRNEPIAPGVPTQPLNFKPEADGRVLVDISAKVTAALLTLIRQNGDIVSTHPEYDAIRARLPLGALEVVAGSADVRWIRPALEPKTHTGRLTSEGDTTHRAGLARTNFNVMGAGVKVGVISDSVDFLAGSLASGDVPSVTILPGQAGCCTGEGTAMLEIVADLAPKAQLFFSSANGGPAQFAQNIRDLRAAGCDIIVDDIIYLDESPFQDGIVADAVNTVTAGGALYFSSAGNEGNLNKGTSGTWEGNFSGQGTFTYMGGTWTPHTYGNTTLNLVPLTSSPGDTSLFWSDPLRGSTNDYDLFIIDPTNNMVVASSTNPQTGTQDPYEDAGVAYPGQAVLVARARGVDRFLHFSVFRGLLTTATAGEIRGHNCASNAFGVAAVNVATRFPNAFIAGAANPVETFSSDGPRRMFYDAAGNPYNPSNFLATGGIVRAKPDIAAADGVKTTTPGFNPFFGTSAAAPHAAALAALIKSYNPGLTPQQLRFALTNTALDIEAPGMDPDSGWGIVDPIGALTSIPPPLPTLIASNLSGGNLNGIIEPNECNDLDLVLRNNAVNPAANIVGTLSTVTPNVTISVPVQSYPNMPPGSTATNSAPFRFFTSPGFACGTAIDFTLVVSSSLGFSTNNFTMTSGAIGLIPVAFSNFTVTPIPDPMGTNFGLVDVPIAVSNFPGSIGKITVSLHLLHPSDRELGIGLFAPDGTFRILSFRHGGTAPDYGLSCTEPTVFDESGTKSISDGLPPFLGTFKPEESLLVFNGKSGTNVNGTWRLRVGDFRFGLTGTVQCVTLTIYPALCNPGSGDCSSDLAVNMTDMPDPVLVGSNLTYNILVTNVSPRVAPATTLFDSLPPGVNVVSLSSSRGSCSASAGSVSCLFGSLPAGGSATVTINVRPTRVGIITNTATVASIAPEVNPLDNNAVVITTVQNPMPLIVPFATSLLAESGPITGGLEPGETVTVNFYLRNVGTLDTTNLIAKLLPTGGVKDPSDQQDYGALVPFGAAAARPFEFEAVGTNGGVVTATFQLQEGSTNVGAPLGFVSFTLGLGGAGTLVNQSVIGIPFSGPAALYPSSVLVSGLAGVVNNVTVTLSNVNHSFPADLDVLLVSPGGQKVLLMSDAGASVGVTNVVLKFDDAAAAQLPQEGPIVSGTYRPTDYTDLPPEAADIFPFPAPAGPYAATLAAFNGQIANGLWSLYVLDDFAGDNGRIAGGWQLAFSTIDPLNPNADLAVSIVDSPDPVMLGSNVTYTVTVTNAGPEVGLGVQLSTTLPAGMSFVSVAAQQGSCSNNLGSVLCDLGSILRSNSVAVSIVATATGLGSQTVTAQAAGSVVDFNPANNTAVATTFIQANADLAVAMFTTPTNATVNTLLTYTLTVINRGPNHASGVTVTNVLPPGVSNLAFNASQGICSEAGGVVTCSLGTILSGAQAAVVVVVTTPSGVGPLVATASVGGVSPPDPNPANNQVTITTSNINPSYIIVPAMAFLVSESGPVTGGIDPGETNQINFELRNEGSQPTATLVGTLQRGGGVVPLSPARTYGVLQPMGAAVGGTFTFMAEGTNGGVITATLQLQDGPLDLGLVSFTFPLGNVVRYAAPTPLDVPEFGPVGLYPSTLSVSGLSGVVSKVSVTLSNLSHTYPDDLDILLLGPTNRYVMLMSDAGGGNALADVTLTFDDTAANALPDRFAIVSGAYRPTDYDSADLLPPPAPAGPYPSTLGVFDRINPNGTWSLFIYDDTFSDQGRLAGGWSLEITTVGVINPQPSLLVAGRINAAGRFEFMLKGQAGGKYLLQSSPDMRSWTTVGNAVLAPSNTLLFSDPTPAGSAPRFYRALHIP